MVVVFRRGDGHRGSRQSLTRIFDADFADVRECPRTLAAIGAIRVKIFRVIRVATAPLNSSFSPPRSRFVLLLLWAPVA